jgi:hypothetical protein
MAVSRAVVGWDDKIMSSNREKFGLWSDFGRPAEIRPRPVFCKLCW